MSRISLPLRMTTEISVAISLAAVMGLIKLISLPYGGSVNLSELPILIVALRHGVKIGSITGGLYGVVDCMLDPHIFYPIQFLLDYPLAYAMLGMTGFALRGGYTSFDHQTRGLRWKVAIWIVLGNALRFMPHYLSGIIFFGDFAPEGQPVWLYALIYNASYILPETLIGVLMLPFILRFVLRGREANP